MGRLDIKRDITVAPASAAPTSRMTRAGGGASPRESSRPGSAHAGASGGSARDRCSEEGRRASRKREFTKTQEQLLRLIAAETAVSGGLTCTKRELAERLGRNVQTINRLVADLRDRGYIEVEMRFDGRGGQLPSRYRTTPRRPSR